MSSKRAMRQAQKQAYSKHRSNITNSRIEKYISISCPGRSSEENVVFGIYFLY